MSKTFEQALPPQSIVSRIPFYYGWVNMVFAAMAMVATLPARSVGIGLITEPLLQDLNLQRLSFAQMNFWATLVGASFSLLCGPAIDRFGVRTVVSLVLFALSWIVLAFSSVASATVLLVLLILMRGFGQSALSVVSLTMIGKWFVRRLSKAMGVFSVLVSLGFVVAIVLSENAVLEHGWRSLLLLSYLREGVASRSWAMTLQVIEQLAANRQPQYLNTLERVLDDAELLQVVEKGLAKIPTLHFRPQQQLKQVASLLACDPAGVPLVSVEVPPLLADDQPPAANPTPALQRWIRRARALRSNQWFQYSQEGQPDTLLQLVWIADDYGLFVFANHQGTRSLDLGRIRAIPITDVNWVRGIYFIHPTSPVKTRLFQEFARFVEEWSARARD